MKKTKNMNIFRKNSGITLIALIVTIIIMLILVTLTIRIAINGDLFGYAGRAATETKEAKAQEQLEDVRMAWEVEKNTNEDASLATFLASAKTNGKIDDYRMVEEYEYVIEKDGYEKEISGGRLITFYVYHSSDNTVETIEQMDYRTFNIYEHTKEDYYYAGYFNDYEGKGSYRGNGVEAIDGTEIAYDGTNATWVYGNGYTENGKQMHPQDRTTYYLRELPKDKFLKYYLLWGTNGGIISSFYNIYALDDGNYNEAGILLNDRENRVGYTKFRSSITFQLPSGNETYTPERCFGITGRWKALL